MMRLTAFLLLCTVAGGGAGWTEPLQQLQTQNFVTWGSYGKPSTFSMFGYGNSNGPTSISVVQVNGKTHIALNGINVDLTKARVVREDQYNVVLSPIEVPEAVITLSKMEHGKISIDYQGQHYESLRPEDINNMINANMAQVNHQMHQLQQQISNMEKNMFSQFKNFPFGPNSIFGGGFPFRR